MTAEDHQWIAMVVYNLAPAQAQAMMDGPPGPPTYGPGGEAGPELLPDGRANLRISQIDHTRTAIGCYRCEQPYSPQTASEFCPGEPKGYRPDGAPVYA